MDFDIGNGMTLHLPSLPITIIVIIIIILLVRWSKQLATRRFTVYFYFLISIYIAPLYTQITEKGVFQLWVPLGFIVVSIYLYGSKRFHQSKVKASLLGLCVAVYQIILNYVG